MNEREQNQQLSALLLSCGHTCFCWGLEVVKNWGFMWLLLPREGATLCLGWKKERRAAFCKFEGRGGRCALHCAEGVDWVAFTVVTQGWTQSAMFDKILGEKYTFGDLCGHTCWRGEREANLRWEGDGKKLGGVDTFLKPSITKRSPGLRMGWMDRIVSANFLLAF